MAVNRDARRRTDDAVLDHRTLCEDDGDDRPDALNTALTSPTPLIGRSTLTTIVTHELTQHPVEAIKRDPPCLISHTTSLPTSH